MNKEILKEVLVSQKKLFLDKTNLFKREILSDFYVRFGKIKEAITITGVRRCGKSSLMRLIWEEFKLKEKLSDNKLLYVNFEDERLVGFSKDDFARLLEANFELYGQNLDNRTFLFLDEIQNIPFWEKWINRIYEENRYKIFITGSNATLLSSELSTALTGRNIPVTLHPLSFYEYMAYFKAQKISKNIFYDQSERVNIVRGLAEYLRFGGMPEYLKTQSSELIQEYFGDIISRDIVNRYQVKYKQGIKELAHLLLANLGQVQSLGNISKSIEIKNINTIRNYLKYLEDAFLFFHLPLFSHSYKRQLYNPDKYYTVDVAFFNNIAFKTSENAGSIYENTVFLELRRNPQNEIFYYKTKKNLEIDFVAKKENKKRIYQVCYDLSSAKTVEREERAILAAMEELDAEQGFILNREIEKIEERNGKEIHYQPLWKWLLKSRVG
jgi:predicted AAA+ superfamily ATPase